MMPSVRKANTIIFYKWLVALQSNCSIYIVEEYYSSFISNNIEIYIV